MGCSGRVIRVLILGMGTEWGREQPLIDPKGPGKPWSTIPHSI